MLRHCAFALALAFTVACGGSQGTNPDAGPSPIPPGVAAALAGSLNQASAITGLPAATALAAKAAAFAVGTGVLATDVTITASLLTGPPGRAALTSGSAQAFGFQVQVVNLNGSSSPQTFSGVLLFQGGSDWVLVAGTPPGSPFPEALGLIGSRGQLWTATAGQESAQLQSQGGTCAGTLPAFVTSCTQGTFGSAGFSITSSSPASSGATGSKTISLTPGALGGGVVLRIDSSGGGGGPDAGGQAIYASGYDKSGALIARMDDIQGNGWMALRGNAAGTDQFKNPFGIAVDASGSIYVTDQTRVIRTNITGSSWQVLYGQDGGTDRFARVEGIAVDGAGNLFVTDWGGEPSNSRVIMTEMTGTAWKVLGSTGSGPGQFSAPGQIATDGQFLYVADRGNARVVQTTISGTPWNVLTKQDGGTERFVTPRGIALDPKGMLIVADEMGHRVVRADITGTVWQDISIPALSLPDGGIGDPDPTNAAVAADGTVYIASYFLNYLAQVPPTGVPTMFSASPDGGTFSQVFGLAVGP